MSDHIEVEDVTLLRQTEKAGLFEFDDGRQEWIPWSQVADESIGSDGEVGSLFLTEWICKQKGLEY